MITYGRLVGVIAGIAGATVIGYCVYFDKKRRSDPQFKQKLKEKRRQAKTEEKNSKKINLPDLKDEEAVQKFFLEEVQKGEEYLACGNIDSCVNHLTNAIAVCGQPQQLLNVFKKTLPPNVFQLLIQNLAQLGSGHMQQMPAGAQKPAESDDTDALD